MKATTITNGFTMEWDDICANRHGGDAQSQSANARTNKDRDAARILDILGECGDFTCEEASQHLKMPYTTASARFSDLKRAGLIEPTFRRKTRSGCTAMAWRKVEK